MVEREEGEGGREGEGKGRLRRSTAVEIGRGRGQDDWDEKGEGKMRACYILAVSSTYYLQYPVHATCSIHVPRTVKYISELLGTTSWTTEPREMWNLWWRW